MSAPSARYRGQFEPALNLILYNTTGVLYALCRRNSCDRLCATFKDILCGDSKISSHSSSGNSPTSRSHFLFVVFIRSPSLLSNIAPYSIDIRLLIFWACTTPVITPSDEISISSSPNCACKLCFSCKYW
ncbi:hypothetical protein GDO81_023095 [Engystomops pustulosus]|uniref:Uncharacterized protein n=1 Tax=Engystomops pustulosus TaxID=76066 RepID=A0AAV6Z570_ENGPU|nr:hypothetical protein GDO81_023095 [Engystomops pustulosus]